MAFGEFFLWALYVFYLFALLIVLFIILTDLFRDQELSGWWKAVWVVALLLLPFITALIYLIARGKGMQQRRVAEMKDLQAKQQEYIQSITSGMSPAEQIASAKELLDNGAINQDEYDALKAKALA